MEASNLEHEMETARRFMEVGQQWWKWGMSEKVLERKVKAEVAGIIVSCSRGLRKYTWQKSSKS